MYGALSGAAHARGYAHDDGDQRLGPRVRHPYAADGFELTAKWSTAWQLDGSSRLMNVVVGESRGDAEEVYKTYSPAIWALSDAVPAGFFE